MSAEHAVKSTTHAAGAPAHGPAAGHGNGHGKGHG